MNSVISKRQLTSVQCLFFQIIFKDHQRKLQIGLRAFCMINFSDLEKYTRKTLASFAVYTKQVRNQKRG